MENVAVCHYSCLPRETGEVRCSRLTHDHIDLALQVKALKLLVGRPLAWSILFFFTFDFRRLISHGFLRSGRISRYWNVKLIQSQALFALSITRFLLFYKIIVVIWGMHKQIVILFIGVVVSITLALLLC